MNIAQSLEKKSIGEMADAIWDICDATFDRDFHDRFHSSLMNYTNFLKDGFAQVLTDPAIGSVLTDEGIDRVGLHYRTQRVKEDHPTAWKRVFCKENRSATEPMLIRDTREYYGVKSLPKHVFRKAKKNKILGFEFKDEKNDDERELTVNDTTLIIPCAVSQVFRSFLKAYRESDSEKEVTSNIVGSLKERRPDFLQILEKYCIDNLEGHLQHDEERVVFIMDSSLITLILLNEGTIHLPRALLLIPVYAGSKGVGGTAFFSQRLQQSRSNERQLKYLAMSLLSYVAVLEGRETEYDKRRLEANSPVVHLFIHSINKAFTTPILNICDDVDQAAGILATVSDGMLDEQSSASSRSSDLLTAIATYLRSFSRRWSGTFAALSPSQPSQEDSRALNGSPESSTIPRFLELEDFDGEFIKDELAWHVKALFAVQLANDIFDCADFAKYRPYLETMDGLQKVVDLRFELRHSIPAQQDVLLLHLLGLVQNSFEALPLGAVLRKYSHSPRQLKNTGFWIAVMSKDYDDNTVAIEVSDNGCGFHEAILRRLNNYLREFSEPSALPPSSAEIRQRIETEDRQVDTENKIGSLSSKSGGALGMGILSVADYVSRICLVEWPPLDGEPNYPNDRAVIRQRGKVEIESSPSNDDCSSDHPRSTVRILLPKRCVTLDQGVFLERRD